MSLKALYYLPMTDSNRMPPHGRYLRSQKHDKHVWDGREFDLENPEDLKAFNDISRTALAYYPDRVARPQPLVFQEEEATFFESVDNAIPEKKPRGWHLRKENRKPNLIALAAD
jgi:hypothetical protein